MTNAAISKTMTAARIHQFGGPDQVKLEQIAVPSVASDEVLVKVFCAGINPVDWKIREGHLKEMLPHTLPLTLGWDVAGEVVAKGDAVNDLNIGDAIYSRPDIGRNGSYAEYIAVKASEVAIKPSSLSWSESAAVPLAALTAWQALYDIAQLKAGDKVLIHAGAGGVGHLAIQLAKLKGATVYTTASKKNHEFVTSLGADEAINYHEEDFTRLKDLDVVFDTMGYEIQEKSFGCLKEGGILVSVVAPPEAALAEKHNVKSEFCFVQPNRSQLNELAALFDKGEIRIEVAQTLPLADIHKALEQSESGTTRGKLTLSINK